MSHDCGADKALRINKGGQPAGCQEHVSQVPRVNTREYTNGVSRIGERTGFLMVSIKASMISPSGCHR